MSIPLVRPEIDHPFGADLSPDRPPRGEPVKVEAQANPEGLTLTGASTAGESWQEGRFYQLSPINELSLPMLSRCGYIPNLSCSRASGSSILVVRLRQARQPMYQTQQQAR